MLRHVASWGDRIPQNLTKSTRTVLSSRAIAAGELETLLRLLGPLSERQRRDLRRASDIVLVREGAAPGITGRARASSSTSTTPPMRSRASKRHSPHEHRHSQARAGLASQLSRSSERRRSPRRSAIPSLGPSESPSLRSTPGNAMCCSPCRRACSMRRDRAARARRPRSRLPGRCCRAASAVAFRRETLTEVELVSGGLAISLPGDRPAMLRGLSLRHDGPAVLIVDEASRVRDELWATISPMLAAAPAAQQILLSTPAGASGEFHRAWTSGEDWERVQITADQCPRISAEHLAAERIRLATPSTVRSISVPSSQRRVACSTPRCWRTCSAIPPRRSATSRLPWCKDG